MTNQSVGRVSSEKQMVSTQQNLRTVEVKRLIGRMKEVHESISRRAYGFFEGRGYQHGHDVEDWLRAESELLRFVPVQIKESNNQLTVLAEMPDFSAQEIEISAEPRRLLISGRKEPFAEKTMKEVGLHRAAIRRTLRMVDLPCEVDSSQVTAILKDGVLRITLPKTVISAAARAE